VDLTTVPEHSRRAAKYDFFKVLENNRIRYYDKFKPARNPGSTAGARMVLEVDSTTGEVTRTWYESYDSQNRVVQVHPKRPIDLGHIQIDPQTGKEINRRP
jgi:hypothetical protein